MLSKVKTLILMQNLPIFHRLFLVFIVSSLGLTLFAGIFYSNYMTMVLRASAAQEAQFSLSSLSENVEHKLHDVENLLRFFESSPVVGQLLEAHDNEIFFLRPEVEKQFIMLGKVSDGFEDLRLIDSRGKEKVVIHQNKRIKTFTTLDSYDRNDTFQRETASLYNRLQFLSPRTITTSKHFKTAEGADSILLGIYKMDPDTGGFGGAIIAHLNLTRYLENLFNFKLFGQSLLWIFDADSNLILSPSEEDQSQMDYISSKDQSLPKDMLVLKENINIGSDNFELFNLAILVSPKMFSVQTQGVTNRIFIISLVVMVIATGLAFLISRQFSRPIKKLVKASDQIREGNLDVTAPEDAGGEIGTLSKSFNEMTKSLRNTMVSRELYQNQSEFLKQVMESIMEPFYVIDIHNNSVMMANSAASPSGLWQRETCHSMMYNSSAACNCADRPCPISLVKEKKQSAVVEHLYTDESGHTRYREAHAYPIFDGQGNLIQMIEYMHDITPRKKVQQELKATQAQMLHQEKMASIGLLSAGVAHEINNPIGFISSNLMTMKKYVQRLFDYIQGADDIFAVSTNEQSGAELQKLKKNLKISYISEDIFDLIEESKEGIERVTKIVQNLKTFSRLDESDQKQANLNDCLDSTLNIVWNELKYKATVNKDYGEIPDILCFPQRLNQVFLNLLVNAVQAIETQGEITIRTWSQGDEVKVSISDTGSGIQEEKIKNIFLPFFTTKDVGKGTGLGLSISYEIIKAHNGEIGVVSKQGEGTTFTVSLPT